MGNESIILPISKGTPVSFSFGSEGITVSGLSFWKDNVARYLNSLREQPATRKSYTTPLNIFLKWITDNGSFNRRLTSEDIDEFRNYLHSRMNKNGSIDAYTVIDGKKEALLELNTVNLYLCAIKCFFRYLEEKRRYEDIARNIRLYKSERQEFMKMHLTEEEARALIDYFREQPIVENANNPYGKVEYYRNLAIVSLMLHNGLRTIEVSRARVGGLKLEYGGHILYVRGKGRQTANDFVVLSNKAYDAIREYISVLGPVNEDAPLFVTTSKGRLGKEMTTRRIQQIIKDALVAIGLTGREYSPHSLRHTTAVQLLRHDASIYDIQMVMRHKDPKITERYLLSAQKEERIRSAKENILDECF